MSSKLSEQMAISAAIPPQDVCTSDVTSSYISVAGYRRIYACATVKGVADTKAVNLKLWQREAAGSGTPAQLGSTVTKTVDVSSGETEDVFLEIDAEVEDMTSGMGFVAVEIESDDSGKYGAGVLILGVPRYNEAAAA